MDNDHNMLVLNFGPSAAPASSPTASPPHPTTSAAPSHAVSNAPVPLSSLPREPLPEDPTPDLDLLAFYGVHELAHSARLTRRGNRPPRPELARRINDLQGPEIRMLITENDVPTPDSVMPDEGKLLRRDAQGRYTLLEPMAHFDVPRMNPQARQLVTFAAPPKPGSHSAAGLR